jgi:phosphoglycerol transferase MdoB-like AlkP superfamily enzyme
MTEFSLMTGISSRAFGSSGQYIFHRSIGRVKLAVPLILKSMGYATNLMATVSRRFLGYDAFYQSIGVENRIFMHDLGAPFDHPDLRKHHSDQQFYERVMDEIEQATLRDSRPQWFVLLTNFNHGPHTRQVLRGQLSQRGRAAALREFPDAEYGEYYARMMFSAKAYAKFRAGLAEKFPGRPILIIRYGDHQPKFVKNILKAKKIDDFDPLTFETFYSIEAVNFELDKPARPVADPLDVAFLPTLAMRVAGMNLPPILAAHEEMMRECGSNYHDTPSDIKARFHRTLIRDGFLEAQPQP